MHLLFSAQGDRTAIGQRLGRGRKIEGKRRDGTLFPMLVTLSEVLLKGSDQRQFTAAMRDLSQLMSIAGELSTQRYASAGPWHTGGVLLVKRARCVSPLVCATCGGSPWCACPKTCCGAFTGRSMRVRPVGIALAHMSKSLPRRVYGPKCGVSLRAAAHA